MIAGTQVKIGPRHQGRRMSLKAFEFAQVETGHVYELARGMIVVSEAPNFRHMRAVAAIRKYLILYQALNPSEVYEVLASMECKVLVAELESERHPDIAVYKSAPRRTRGRTMWRTWVPDLVVEVVSPGSADRDYVEKREEYWARGVKEYWIVDLSQEQVLVLKRGKNRWTEKILESPDVWETKLLPGFTLVCREIFAAAADEGESEANS